MFGFLKQFKSLNISNTKSLFVRWKYTKQEFEDKISSLVKNKRIKITGCLVYSWILFSKASLWAKYFLGNHFVYSTSVDLKIHYPIRFKVLKKNGNFSCYVKENVFNYAKWFK